MSFAATFACFPSESVEVRRVSQKTRQGSRTVNHHLHLVVYNLDSITNAVCDPKDLRARHTSLLLRQSVQLLQSVLQVSHSSQFPQELFCEPFSEDLSNTVY